MNFGKKLKHPAKDFAVSPQKDVSIVDRSGKMGIFDIETGKLKFNVQAHAQKANVVDSVGGTGPEYCSPEIVTGGSDGCVRVWDPRQKNSIVYLQPDSPQGVTDICFGDKYNQSERCVVAGYENGNAKIFDLRMGSGLMARQKVNDLEDELKEKLQQKDEAGEIDIELFRSALIGDT